MGANIWNQDELTHKRMHKAWEQTRLLQAESIYSTVVGARLNAVLEKKKYINLNIY